MGCRKTLNQVQGRIKGTENKGFMVWGCRTRIGDKVLYTLYAEDATVECGETSTGVKYDVFKYGVDSRIRVIKQVDTDKVTAKLNGLFEGLVEFVAREYELGIRKF